MFQVISTYLAGVVLVFLSASLGVALGSIGQVMLFGAALVFLAAGALGTAIQFSRSIGSD